MLFRDRKEAGGKLAAKLKRFAGSEDSLVLALPRGGVVVAKEVALALKLPLDILVPMKIGAPYNPELAIGAICEDEIFLNEELITLLHVDDGYLTNAIESKKKEAMRRKLIYRKGRKEPDCFSKNIILIDDGIATGATVFAAIRHLKTKNPKFLAVAVPVAPADSVAKLKLVCDEVIALYAPANFLAIGEFYDNFPQTTDKEVLSLLG